MRPQARVVVAALQLITVGVAALHWYVRTLPATPTPIPTPEDAEAAWWGLWPMTYLPTWALAAATLALLLYLFAWWLVELGWRTSLRSPRWPALPWFYLLALLLVVAFYRFPLQHTRWGDAYILSNALALDDPTLRLTHSWQAPLDVWLHSRVWHWLHAPLVWEDGAGTYHLLSPLAGALYLVGVYRMQRRLRSTPAWLTFGLLTSLGILQLFFGYIENYSFAAAGILIYLGLGLASLQQGQPLWPAATALAITNAFHPSTVVLLPSLLYSGWRRWRHGQMALWSVIGALALPLLLVGLATMGMMEAGGHGLTAFFTTDRPGGGDARFFVPLWETTTRWEQYTLFSWLHLRDMINQQLLVAPLVLPSLLIVGFVFFRQWAGRRRQPGNTSVGLADRIERNFLALAAGSHLLLIWLWNPDYGGQRDWDLFSLAAIATTVLLAHSLPRALSHPHAQRGGAIGLLMVQYLQLAAWVYQNTLPWQWP